MAIRIAESVPFMGLDDKDEELLWRYFAIRKEKSSEIVIKCLKDHAELQAVEILRVEADVSIPMEWVKACGVLMKKKKSLAAVLLVYGEDGPCIEYSPLADVKKAAIEEARTSAFKLWYDHLEARVVEGRLVEPSSEDIKVSLRVDATDLRAALGALAV